MTADENQEAVNKLQKQIEAIDFDGGLAPVGATSAASTQDTPVTKLEADETPTRTADPESSTDTDLDGGNKEAEADSDPTQDSDNGGEEDDKPALSDSHYRAAIRMGMSPEEISELYDKSPDLAVKTVAKCYEMVNKTSQQLGALGRATQKQAQAGPVAQSQQQQDAPQSNARIGKLIERIKDHYDGADDPLADVLIEVLQDRRERPQPQPQPQSQPQQAEIPQRSVEEEIAARQQINTFFGSNDLEAYSDLYGENASALGDWSHLTPGQRANRKEVCERAHMILYGAAVTGMEMGTAEAMERAHLEIAAPMAEQVVRHRIAASAKKRERGLTLKPNGNRTPDRAGPGKFNRAEALDEMAAKLREVFA